MEKLTIRQKEVFDAIIAGHTNLSEIARLVEGEVSRQAVRQRAEQMVEKGYLRRDKRGFVPTDKGLDRMLQLGGRTKASYYDKTTTWAKTLRPDAARNVLEATTE